MAPILARGAALLLPEQPQLCPSRRSGALIRGINGKPGASVPLIFAAVFAILTAIFSALTAIY